MQKWQKVIIGSRCSFLCLHILTWKDWPSSADEGDRAGSDPQSFNQEGYIGQGRTRKGILGVVGYQSIFLATFADGELCLTRQCEDISAERRKLRSYIHLYLSVNLNHASLLKNKAHQSKPLTNTGAKYTIQKAL